MCRWDEKGCCFQFVFFFSGKLYTWMNPHESSTESINRGKPGWNWLGSTTWIWKSILTDLNLYSEPLHKNLNTYAFDRKSRLQQMDVGVFNFQNFLMSFRTKCVDDCHQWILGIARLVHYKWLITDTISIKMWNLIAYDFLKILPFNVVLDILLL